MSELIGTLLELTSVVGQVQENAPLIAAAAAVPMLSLASWRLVSQKIRTPSHRLPPLAMPKVRSLADTSSPGADSQPDPLRLYQDFARKRGAHLLVLPTQDTPATSTGIGSGPADNAVLDFSEFLITYRRIHATTPIDIILPHSVVYPLWFLTRVARLLAGHKAKVSAFVPHQVYGTTCLLLFAVDEIHIWRDAALVFDPFEWKASIKAAKLKGRRRMSDEALLKLHETLQLSRETRMLVSSLLRSKGIRRADRISMDIANGRYTNGNPARVEDLRRWGLNLHVVDALEDLEVPDEEMAKVVLASTDRRQTAYALTVAPTCSQACPIGNVRDAMLALEGKRSSTLISIIHASGTDSDRLNERTTAEALKAIRATEPSANLDIILHTGGGSALGADQLVKALKQHRGRKTFFVPYNAYSAGTILALTGDQIFLSSQSVLGPIDTQYGGVPVARLASLLKYKHPNRIDDDNLELAVFSRDRIAEDYKKALALMSGNYSRWTARRIAHFLNDGMLTHGYPVQYEEAKKIGLHVTLGIPDEVYTIVDSYLFQPGNFCSVIHCSGEDEGAAA